MEKKLPIRTDMNNMVPQYITEDHPLFVSFLEAYYEFLEREHGPISFTRNALSYVDPSETLDEFITMFFEEIKNLPKNILANKSLLAQHIYELYQVKGTMKGYELLFRILYDEDISIYLPKLDLLRPSDGKWVRDYTIRATLISGDVFSCVGKVVRQYDSRKVEIASARIEKINHIREYDVYDIFINPATIEGTFEEFNLVCDDVRLTPISSPKFDLRRNRGSGYSPGDVIQSDMNTGMSAIVGETRGGKITEVIIVDGGSGHYVGEKFDLDFPTGTGADIRVSEVNSGAVTKVAIISGGQGYEDFYETTLAGNGKFIFVGQETGGINSVVIRDPGHSHLTPPETFIDTKAVILPYGEFYEDEPVTLRDSVLTLETFFEILLEDGYSISSEEPETTDTSLVVTNISGNIAYIRGIYGKIELTLEDSSLFLLEDDGIIVCQNSNSSPMRRTLVGVDSGTKARVLFINPAEIDSVLGTVFEPGYRFINDDGKPSEITKKIQDSWMYQDFSYVIHSGHTFEEYKDAIYKIMHPAGLIAFGIINIENSIKNKVKVVGTAPDSPYDTGEASLYDVVDKWLEENKFYYGPRDDTFVGANNVSRMRDVPSIFDTPANYNTPNGAFGSIKFTDYYEYAGSEYTIKYKNRKIRWESEVGIYNTVYLTTEPYATETINSPAYPFYEYDSTDISASLISAEIDPIILNENVPVENTDVSGSLLYVELKVPPRLSEYDSADISGSLQGVVLKVPQIYTYSENTDLAGSVQSVQLKVGILPTYPVENVDISASVQSITLEHV